MASSPEPGYEIWHEVEIEERCIETFDTRTLADGKQLGNRCMNCHTHGGNEGQYSYFYIRGEKGGTFVNRDNKFEKMTLSSASTNGSTVYGNWHSSGRFGVFSTNEIIPAFHADPALRMEVYDTHSDLCIADFDTQRMITSPLVSGTSHTLETFPCFSADGKTVYYCSAPNPCGDSIPRPEDLQHQVKGIHYSLHRIGFDADSCRFAGPVETVVAATDSTSIHFPHFSPDGRWLSYCESRYGTFPIWHMETRIVLAPAQQPDTVVSRTRIHATYHTWSHNARWIAFASKDYDTQYGRVYLVHISPDGTLSHPLVLPQADPAHDDMCLKSYNIPDLTMHPAPFGHDQVKQLLESAQAIPFTFPEGIVLPAGGSVVVAKDVTDIPSGHHAEQWESGKLADEGEAIALTTPSGVTIDQVAYLPTAPWPAITEGGERAIVLKDLLKANHIGTNWQLKRTVDIADILPPHSPLRAYDLQGRPADLRSTHGLIRKIQRK